MSLDFDGRVLLQRSGSFIDKGAATAKVGLHDASVARSVGYSAPELGKIQRMVINHQPFLKEAWHAFFGT